VFDSDHFLRMKNRNRARPPGRLALLAVLLSFAAIPAAAQTIRIRVGSVIDGKGGVQRNVDLVVDGSRIRSIAAADGTTPTYDLSRLTLLPGLIDTHVHITSHFGKDGRASNTGETPAEQILYAAENAYATLMAGFTTIQSIGASGDFDLRAAQ
jgi:imidazolonepropionase-like amidohydrolase